MDDEDRLPFIAKEALNYFQRLFPDKAPELKDSDREIWFNRGAAEVIRHMAMLYEIQNENILTGVK